MKNDAWDKLMQCLGKSDDHTPDVREWLIDSWKSVRSPMELERETLPQKLTAIDHQAVETVSQKLGSAVPEGFVPHKNLERILARRKQTVDSGKNIDWATAEALAFSNTIAGGHDCPCLWTGCRTRYLLSATFSPPRSTVQQNLHPTKHPR
ncbi:unnamed protein product [Aspergillus oryzae RIB40]|uniref:DNA, SC005 n=1 Tax=Aspergillus oryzae (strain ATCC 42149 / RIB 40) TaxID=510516 RepID=Q2UQN5_ASPOR|nr:unnamed protein product [Aspergillus oryzae RIB40]BAE56130.1 unnamed protein product [Aspergillus oryzae RIB40]